MRLMYPSTNLHRVTSQKSQDPTYTSAKAWNRAVHHSSQHPPATTSHVSLTLLERR